MLSSLLCTDEASIPRSPGAILTRRLAYYLTFLIQLAAYLLVAAILLLGQIRRIVGPKSPQSTDQDRDRDRHSSSGFLLSLRLALRTFSSSCLASLAMLCGAQALLHCPNLPVLVMLPIVTYVADSLFFRLAYVFRILPQDQSVSAWRFYKVVLVLICACPPVVFDYRLNVRAMLLALLGLTLFSLSRVVACIGPRIEPGRVANDPHVGSPLRSYLGAGFAPLAIAGVATLSLENVKTASHLAWHWGLVTTLWYLGPGVLLHIFFRSSMNSAYPFTPRFHVGGALEELTASATDAVASTLQAGFFAVLLGVLGQERNYVHWFQVMPATLVYVVCVGPKHIGYYPPRLLNLIFWILRRRQIPVQAKPWQFSFFRLTTAAIFAVLISSNTKFWIDSVAYNHDLKRWVGPSDLFVDGQYRPPQLRSFDVVIAHSEGDPIETITALISTFAAHPSIAWLSPRVLVYSKDPNFLVTEEAANSIKGDFGGTFSMQSERNVGGVAASFLHHILHNWDVMPAQTLFLSTASTNAHTLPLHTQRFSDYFLAMGFPLPDSVPKTAFLNLGEQETCACGDCRDSLGWEDSFHLVPSMWAAVRPGAPAPCGEALLTYGNSFAASVARIRGVKRDVWEVLYDALVNEDWGHAWAHKKEKMPLKRPGEEEGRSRFAPGAVYGQEDSLERPYLGLTVERLWAVLLQCSEPRIAWGCPSLEIGWRLDGTNADCECIE